MKKIIWLFFIVLISCTEDNMCEEINNSFISKLKEVNEENSKEESKDILNNWIVELRKDNCSPYTYYEYYDDIINK